MNSYIRICVVLILTATTSACALTKGYREGHLRAQEAYLQDALSMMRKGISRYDTENGRPPQTLDELVEGNYITLIPRDPITNELNWIIVIHECPTPVPDNCKQGIKDIHSASTAKSSRGNPYSDW